MSMELSKITAADIEVIPRSSLVETDNAPTSLGSGDGGDKGYIETTSFGPDGAEPVPQATPQGKPTSNFDSPLKSVSLSHPLLPFCVNVGTGRENPDAGGNGLGGARVRERAGGREKERVGGGFCTRRCRQRHGFLAADERGYSPSWARASGRAFRANVRVSLRSLPGARTRSTRSAPSALYGTQPQSDTRRRGGRPPPRPRGRHPGRR